MNEQEYWSECAQRMHHDKDFTHQSQMNSLIESEELNKFSLLKPKFGIDGNQWYVLYGEDLQSGIAGFGDTLYLAILNWNKEFNRTVTIK